MSLSKKEIKALQREIDTYFEEGKNDSFDNFKYFLGEYGCGDSGEGEKLGDHDFKFHYYGQPGSPDADVSDGSPLQWVFEIDGHLFAVEGQYSSWDGHDMNDEWNLVERATKITEYFKNVKA